MELSRSQQECLIDLAQAWLATGATRFALHTRDRDFSWEPEINRGSEADRADEIDRAPDLIAPLKLGELRVWGITGPIGAAQARLNAEARLIGRALQQEEELNEMTSALVDLQDQQLALYALTESTRSQLELEPALRGIARETARLLGAPGAVAYVPLDPAPVIAHIPAPVFEPAELQLVWQAAQSSRQVLLSQRDTPGLLPATVDQALIESIQLSGSRAALLLAYNKPGGFGAPDRKLLHAIAQQAGAQIDNARLHREALARERLQTEMDLARRVQTQLLPKRPPRVPGLDLFARSLPALDVGGDFFDFIVTPDRALMLTVGDVAGKGLASALLMAMAHTVIRTGAKYLNSPAAVLRRVAADLYDDFSEISMFATTFVAQYRAASREVWYANAGHSPVVYRPLGGPARLLEADAMPLGIFADCAAADYALPLGVGDVLAIMTDGFNETFDAREEMFGYERLLNLIEAHADQSAEAIGTALFAAIETFGAGHPPDDDRTLIVLKGCAV
jgi:sigma-B regulation protein RsbU (phosphoserine phosphatase)